MEVELIAEKVVVSSVQGLLRKKDEEMKMVERALRDQYDEVETLKKKCADVETLQAKVATPEKVN